MHGLVGKMDYWKAAAIFVGGPAAILGLMYLVGTRPIWIVGAIFIVALLAYAFTQA